MNKVNGNIINELKDYMFTTEKLSNFTKHIIRTDINPKSSTRNILTSISVNRENTDIVISKTTNQKKQIRESFYKPKQKDSLFWCFYILKNGYSNYEMEIHNQYFSVEKNEKFKYIEMLRKNKDILKIHKIKPFTDLEDDLANKEKISVKTFFALCVLENINVLVVDNRKIFEMTCVDIDESHPVNVIHRNKKTGEHFIELDVTEDVLKKYRETYYVSTSLDDSLKSITSYKLDDLFELCKKLDIDVYKFTKTKTKETKDTKEIEETKKKLTKKDIYELLVLHY